MATPKTITQLTERSGDLALTDEIEVQVAGATSTVKKALSYIKKLVIGTATIGGSATTDIPTLASVGTFTNKRLNSPLLNSVTPVTAYGEWLNTWLTALQTYNSVNDLIRLAGVTSSIQDQLDVHTVDIASAENRIEDIESLALRYDYTLTAGAGSSSIDISDTTILTSLGLTGYIDHMTAIISYYEDDGGKMIQQASSGIIVKYKTVGMADYLDKVTFAVTSGHSYSYYINFKLA